MTKVSPGQRDADNLHAGWSPQLSDIFAFSMNTEVFVLSQTWISLLSLAFALPPFLPIPFFFWSNQTFWFGQESNWKTILKEQQSTQLYPAQPFVRHLPQLQHHWRAICPQPEVSPFLQISTNITGFQIHKQANRNKRTSYCRLREKNRPLHISCVAITYAGFHWTQKIGYWIFIHPLFLWSVWSLVRGYS